MSRSWSRTRTPRTRTAARRRSPGADRRRGRSSLKSSKAAYRADIDGIRAVAILLVVVFHFRLVPGVASGFMGVDLFFVISGFLITRIIREGLRSDTFRLRTFWIHRIRRLAPALIATTLLTLLAGWLWLLPPDFAKLAQQTIAAQLYYANIFYWRNVNYFGLQAHDVYLLHTWSLAVEEQFYLLYLAIPSAGSLSSEK